MRSIEKRTKESCVVLLLLFSASLFACERETLTTCDGDPPDIERPGFWRRESHCRGVEPDYDGVFDDTKVHRFDIKISASDYLTMETDLENIAWNSILPSDLDDLQAPITVPAEISYGGDTWVKVGMRWKGHSSLVGAVKAGVKKLSFILTFDAFEEQYPDLLNQRFFGFKKLIFANGYTDQSFIREKVASEVFRAAGLKVVRNAFAVVYLDFGEGPVYMGVYTFMEDASDQMLEEQFGYYNGIVGNLYKPHGEAARWRDPGEEVSGANEDWWREDIEAHFEKCTNEDDGDWSDVMKAVGRLYKDRNVPAQWRASLEEVFDVESFVSTLAVGQAMMNWDSYGCMHHNYYLYANPLDRGRIYWLPWDLGETMSNRQDSTCYDLDGVMLDEIVYPAADTEIDTYWPLIQYILSDSVYRQAYQQKLKGVMAGPFAEKKVYASMDRYHNLIAPYVVGPKAVEQAPYTTCDPFDCSGFTTSLEGSDTALKPHVAARHAAVAAVLGE